MYYLDNWVCPSIFGKVPHRLVTNLAALSSMTKKTRNDHLIPVQIWRIYPYPDVTPPETFLVVLKGEEERFVPISIGFPEGQYLVMAMQNVSFPRPLTHNLIQNLIDKVKGQVHQLVIHTLKDDTFHAYLLIQTQEEVFYLDCRPSDGMILATLMGIPIYMSPEVMTEAGRELSSMLNITDLTDEAPSEADVSPGIERPAVPGEASPVDGEIQAEVEFQADDDDDVTPQIEILAPGEDVSELDMLRAQLDRLVAEEAYEEAARVRDQISQLEEDTHQRD